MSENPIFSYTKRDYEGSRKEGLARIPIISRGAWTDLNSTDPGVILLDYVHALVDMVNYYQDHQALEAFITTAKERANIFRLAKQLSYEIRSAKGAICDVTFTTEGFTYNHPIKIPKHTSVSTLSGIKYLTTEDAYLPTGSTRVVIPCIQGVLNEKTYTGTGISRFSNIENAENQIIYLTAENIDIDSIQVIDDTGRAWTPVDYIVFSTATDRVYQVELNSDNSVSIKFGDGERGVVPTEVDNFKITYITTQAEEGRVGANAIVVLDDMIINTDGSYVEFSISNSQASTGGSSVQSSTSIRELAPGAIKAQGRAVTIRDFENLARLVEGVADAKAYDINTNPDLCLYHEVKVLILPEDPQGSNELLNNRVYNYLYQKMIPPTNLQVLTPSLIPVDISLTVKKVDNEVSSRLEYMIRQSVEEYFNSREKAIGESFYPADLATIIASLEGVRYVISITPPTPLQISSLSVAVLGSLTIDIQ